MQVVIIGRGMEIMESIFNKQTTRTREYKYRFGEQNIALGE